MITVPLGEIVQVKGGGTPRKSCPDFFGGEVPWVTPKDMKKWRISDSSVRLTLAGVENSPARIVEPGSVLVVVRSGVLKHTLPVALTTAAVTVNQDLKALTPTREANAAYLAHFIKWKQPTILGWVRATTADNFPIDKLLQLRVPLPPLNEQRRIAAILDQADALRAKRRRALEHLDALQQSIFLDMFGDPDDALRAGRSVIFTDVVADLQGGKSLIAADPDSNAQNRVLKISAVTGYRFQPNESKPLPDQYCPPKEHFVRAGDLLFSRANTTELVGAVALVNEAHPNLVLPDKLWRFIWRDRNEVEPGYVWALLQTPALRRELGARSSGTGGSMKNISKAKLRSLQLPWAPIERQREYGLRLRILDEVRRCMSGVQMDDLFLALQKRAFVTESGGLGEKKNCRPL